MSISFRCDKIHAPHRYIVKRFLDAGDLCHSMQMDRANMLSQCRTMSSPVAEVCMEAMSTGFVQKSLLQIVDELAATRARVHTARAGLLSRQIHTEIVTYNTIVFVSAGQCASLHVLSSEGRSDTLDRIRHFET